VYGGEASGLRHPEPAGQPLLAEPVDVIDGAGEAAQPTRLATGTVDRGPQVRVDRTVIVDRRQLAVIGDRDRRGHLGIEPSTLEFGGTDTGVELVVRELHQLGDQLVEHASIVLEHVFDNKSLTRKDAADQRV